jgi:anti-sigma-K factor RskA
VTDADRHPGDDLAVYALDALDPDEARAVEAHLEICPACRAELDEQRATLGALTGDEPPPPSIWAGIARTIGAEAAPTPLPVTATPRDAGPPRQGVGAEAAPDAAPPPSHLRPGRAARRGPGRWVAAVAAVAAAAVVAVGAAALLRADDGATDLNDVAQAALDAPGARVGTLTSGDGDQAARLVVDGDTGYLLVDDLPVLPEGETYQLWKLGGPAPVSMGTVGDGEASVAAVGVPAGTSQLAISVEPAGGSVAPTINQIVAQGSVPA